MNIKTKEDIYSFNKHKNNESLNKDTSNNIYNSLKPIFYYSNIINVDKILSNKKIWKKQNLSLKKIFIFKIISVIQSRKKV